MPDANVETTYFTRRKPDGTEEQVEGWPWFWVAVYKDGTLLVQCDVRDGSSHQVAEIDRSRLHHIELHRAGGGLRVAVHLPEHARPICGLRRWQQPRNETARQDGPPTVNWSSQRALYCIGWQETVIPAPGCKPENRKVILEFTEDGNYRPASEGNSAGAWLSFQMDDHGPFLALVPEQDPRFTGYGTRDLGGA